MENAMETQKAEREELGRLRMAWHLTAAASKPVKQQWGAFKEQLRKVRGHAVGDIQSEKEMKFWHMVQRGGTLKTLC